MENCCLNDRLGLSEGLSVKGIVVIKDANGNIIVKKHNMIVASGRRAILESLKSTKKLNINAIFFSDKFSKDETTIAPVAYNDVYPEDTKKPTNMKEFEVGTTDTSKFKLEYVTESKTESMESGAEVKSTENEIEPYIKVSGTLSYSDYKAAQIRTLGLLITTTNTKTLFSRIIFEPIPFTDKMESYTIEYYIYF